MIAQAGKSSILLTDAGYRNTLAAVRALSEAGYVVDAVGPHGSCCESSRHLRRLIGPDVLSSLADIDTLVAHLQRTGYAALLPIGARSVRTIACHADQIAEHTQLALHDAASIENCMDKTRLNAVAQRVGLNVPRYWTLDDDACIERTADEARFPIVVKKRHELDRGPVIAYDSARQFRDSATHWRSAHADQSFAPIAQEYVEGDGCAFFALYDRGMLRRWFMHRRIREFPVAGGASSCAESVFEQDLFEAGRRLLDALKWHGVAMVEFKRERSTNVLQLMEVNPKFWGSLDLAIASGVNFPVDTVRLAMGESLEPQSEYAVNRRFHWPFGHGEWLHVAERPRAAWRVLQDCLNPRVRTNIRLTDLAPTWRELRHDLTTLRRRRSAATHRR
ncbi:MAG: ATP-grasp domain-containing protein [Phycisphaerales bacterium]|nr:ATP-grasp domain-containing protein [Phycisphaerales bacterium]MCB9862259.1 ATP-grasp domain-containing protein [Phycisphaerales bacterium]